MATTKITSPDLFDLASLDSALQLPSGTTAERPTSPSTGEWRYNTTNNNIEFYDGSGWVVIADENFPTVPSENFNTVLYTGNGTSQSITGVGFQPDFVWIKCRDVAGTNNTVVDSTRGANETLRTQTTNAETTRTNAVTSFDNDGFALGDWIDTNGSGRDFVAWCFKAKGGTTSSNTDGSVTSTVQANTKAGFSIVKWDGTGAINTVGHGLSSPPELILNKSLDSVADWQVYSYPTGNANKLALNTTAAASSTTRWDSTSPTSSVFTLRDVGLGTAQIAYCFHSVAGFSKIGSYTGTGAAGNQQNTGFEPAFVLIKRTDSAGAWSLYDNKRNTTNPRNLKLVPNSDAAENVAGTTYQLNFFTNGFEFLGGGSDLNASGGTFIYIAFASDPSAAPVLADSFNTTLYDGSGTLRNVSGLGFSPSFAWIKNRIAANSHNLYDTIRGATKLIESDTTDVEATSSTGLTAFLNNGFTVSTGSGVNNGTGQYVSWNWKANSIPTINTDGTIQTIVSANQAAGFSIVKYTGNATNDATVGHGLLQAPELWIGKQLTGSSMNWQVLYSGFAEGDYLSLNLTNAKANSPNVSFDPTATTVKFQGGQALNDTQQNIGYAFHSVSGFSKVGTYVGNGSSSGPTVTTGFQPDFLMTKKATGIANWWMVDSARDTSNPRNIRLLANTSNSETSYSPGNINFNSTGFELAGTSGEINGSGHTYIYMAFKENPAQPAIPSGEMAYLVVAGGGSGHRSDSNNGAGGGGAGGLRSSYVRTGGGGTVESNITLTAKTYTITIGAGGADNSTGGGPAISGSDSVLDTITSAGGGGGGGVGLPAEAATSGGSGGGGGGYNSAAAAAGTANQGFAGGNGSPSTSGTFSERNGGGGGGAGSVGTTGSTSSAGPGGIGVTVPITGTNVGYAGGGSGGNKAGSNIPGTDGGGSGAGTGAIGTAGTANTGGGGGGGGVNSYNGKGGGSGVVILRMNTSDYSGTTTGSPTVTTVGSETILTYTGSGTYVHS